MPVSRLAALGLVVVSVAATSVIVLFEPSLGAYPLLVVLVVLVVAFGCEAQPRSRSWGSIR
jgi:hypothetical protein